MTRRLEVPSWPYTLFSSAAEKADNMYSIIFRRLYVVLLSLIKNDIVKVETMHRRARK